MSYPKEDKDVLGIVVDDGSKSDKKQSGACRVYIPSQYSNEFKLEDLPLIPRLGAAGNESVVTFGGAIELGTPVIVKKTTGQAGSGLGYISQVIKDETQNSLELPGNVSIDWHNMIKKAKEQTVDIQSKAKAGSGEAGSKPTEEAGEKYYRNLVKGIASSSTLWPIAGMKIPQVKSVETATQSFTSIMSASALAGLPGAGLSLGNLFTNMPSAIKDKIFSALPKEIGETLTTITNLMPESSAEGLSGIRINPEVFYANAAEMLSQCRDVSDLINCITDLMTDTSLHGTDTLPNLTIEIDTPFGKANVEFDISGNSTDKNSDDVTKLIGTFTSLLSDVGGGFPSVFPDKNMWGESSKVMGDMFKRLNPQEYTKAIQQAQKAIAPGTSERNRLNTVVSAAMSAKNIFDSIT